MKISYSNYPILEKLKKGSLGTLPIFEDDDSFFKFCNDTFSGNWKFYRKNFEKEINVISKPFYQASIKAEKKLTELWFDILKNDISNFEVKGCYLINDFVYMIDYEVKKGVDDNEICFYMFNKDGIPLAMYIDSVKYKIFQNGWISSCFKEDLYKFNSAMEWIYNHIAKIVTIKMFKNYAEVETKIIQSNSKVNNSDFKFINDTKLNLTYLDSKWFTNLVKSEGFNVRGHFRLQPKKKNGDWTKELIWISEFQKNGYTAPAKILLNKNNQ